MSSLRVQRRVRTAARRLGESCNFRSGVGFSSALMGVLDTRRFFATGWWRLYLKQEERNVGSTT